MTDTDLRAMARVLQAAAIDTDQQYDMTEWNAHVGRNGFRRWVITMGLVKEGPDKKLKARGNRRMYTEASVKLQRCHAAGLCLQKYPMPRTLGEYTAVASDNCKSLVAATNPRGMKNTCPQFYG